MIKQKWITAAEHMALLQKNPEWMVRNAETKAKLLQREKEFKILEGPLLSELEAVGIKVGSAWDFVNTADKYPAAVPVLLRHLALPYHKRIKEGIIRALTVNYAGPEVLRELIKQFCEQADSSANSLKWVLGNAISEVATPADAEAVIALAMDPTHGESRDLITQRLPRIVRNKARLAEILQHLMHDKQTEQYARLAARGKIY